MSFATGSLVVLRLLTIDRKIGLLPDPQNTIARWLTAGAKPAVFRLRHQRRIVQVVCMSLTIRRKHGCF
jgi:hypothetical protein